MLKNIRLKRGNFLNLYRFYLYYIKGEKYNMIKKYIPLIERNILTEMSNLFPEDTGLDFILWISTKSGREKHNARIKISNTKGEAVIMIWGEPKIKSKKGKITITGKQYKNILKFLELNRDTLISHWNGQISSVELGRRIKKI